ncbi:hypothetical protein AMJ52_05140 [candidate division TA06 bacterium DG_78]|uniref:Dephospho-CoA kinase n=1 Tax=candidate division TA06 bacterium DG_78 TaxID=1703772 RepID=A0A0S7YDS6_UNCT6|nr:MAG: hypothetical protein AMJ52_05140 [candidate division TA06 bacterium DG_78]
MQHGERIIIGVGGNVGTGKTTVCKFFESWGAHYISADEVGWKVLPEISHALEEKFGKTVMNEEMVDRKGLRDIVFSQRENLEYLNKLSHPLIIQKILQRIQESTSEMIVIDAALLFDWPEIFEKIDYSILVTAAESIKTKRSMAKGINSDLFKKIVSFQKKDTEISGQANFIIKNNGTMNALKKQCHNIYEEIKNDC